MERSERAKIRDFVSTLLSDREDRAPLSDDESLFVSARLDSLSTVELVEFLEQEFGSDFGTIDFEIERVDSIDAIATLVHELRSMAASSC
jgi:acyl carrier protein